MALVLYSFFHNKLTDLNALNLRSLNCRPYHISYQIMNIKRLRFQVMRDIYYSNVEQRRRN